MQIQQLWKGEMICQLHGCETTVRESVQECKIWKQNALLECFYGQKKKWAYIIFFFNSIFDNQKKGGLTP